MYETGEGNPEKRKGKIEAREEGEHGEKRNGVEKRVSEWDLWWCCGGESGNRVMVAVDEIG